MALVAVVIGSKSDLETIQPMVEILQSFQIEHQVFVMSAHRTPEMVRQFALSARQQGYELIIAAAGLAAHLPGVIASYTTLPVIGVPLAAGELRGLDSLYSIIQMPAGIPVATVAIGSAGVKNAACLAAEILGLKYPHIAEAYEKYRMSMQGESK